MKTKRILIGVAFMVGCSPFNAQAQKTVAWSASQKEVRAIDKATYDSILHVMNQGASSSLLFHSEDCLWDGGDIRLFGNIQSMKEYGFRDSTYAARQLKVLEGTIERGIKLTRGHGTPLVLHIWLKNVSKLAGMQVECMMVYKDSIPVYRASISVPDGRWNDFPTLFAENSEKLVKKLRRKLQEICFYREDGEEWLIAQSQGTDKK